MSLSLELRALPWLLRATFRQACASRLFGLLLTCCLVCLVLCLSLGIDGGATRGPTDLELFGSDGQPLSGSSLATGRMTLAFGLFQVPLFRDGAAMIHFVEVLLAKWVGGAAGILLALVWTAEFVPEFLQPSEMSILLTKPVSRRTLIWGRVFGVIAFVAMMATLFIGGTYLAIGLRTGIWTPGYLWSIPLLCLHFTTIFGVSVALAVWTRNTVVTALASITFWLVCFGVNAGHDSLTSLARNAAGSMPSRPVLSRSLDAAYWILPKPVDLSALLDQQLDARRHLQPTGAFGAVPPSSGVSTPALVLTSLLFAYVMIVVAERSFERLQY